MFEVPAARRRPEVQSADDRAALAAVVDDCERICRAQLELLALLWQQRMISKEAYTGLLARGDQLLAAVAELAFRYSAAEPRTAWGRGSRSGSCLTDQVDEADGRGGGI